MPHIATGDLFRAAIADGTELGSEVEPLLARGQLVPDELDDRADPASELARRRAGRLRARRLPAQPRAGRGARRDARRDRAAARRSCSCSSSPTTTCRERLLKRAELEGRADDTPEVIERRLATYHEQTEPVVEHYRATGKLVKVHARAHDRRGLGRDRQALEQVEGGRRA